MSQQQLDAITQMLRSQSLLEAPSLADMRAGLEQMAAAFPVAPDVECEPVNAGGMKAEWVTAPGAAADRAILYLHGGGYMIGSINSHRDLAARLSRAAEARTLIIDYRLAPENPFPAAVEDATAAYRWLVKSGVKPKRIAVAGDSAGGGLTLATLVALRDAGDPLPAAGVAISPWTDMEGTGDSIKTRAAADPMVQKAGLDLMAKAYLAGKDPRTPLAAPLYANLSGIPPLYILVGDAEILLDDASRVAERARKAGVDVTYECADRMIHVWPLFAAMLDEGQEAIERIGEYVRKRTG